MTMPTTEVTTSLTPGANAEAVVDLAAIAHNVRVLREHAGSAQVMAVVKADGYGHGATQVARAALAAGAGEIGVATIPEALALRRDGITAPVLCLAASARHRLRPRAAVRRSGGAVLAATTRTSCLPRRSSPVSPPTSRSRSIPG